MILINKLRVIFIIAKILPKVMFSQRYCIY
nr:MAG TPA: hypothetical protein [Caudoviricetes sp.]